ncbi:MAG TPA: VgrG-related protein [Actinomycetota bacterium]|nr:VgrG-related protein [Actinomycetota bacterium]
MNPTHSLSVSLAGSPLSASLEELLVSAYVETSLNLPDAFVLTFRDPGRVVFAASSGIQIGGKVTIKVVSDASPSGTVLIEDAEITALEAEHDPLGTLSVVRGLDTSHRLFRGRTTAAYKNMSYSDVAGKVAQRNGLSLGTVDSTSVVHDVITQFNCSDWDFLGGLSAEVGYELMVTKGKLDFRKPQSASGAPGPGTLASTNPLQLTLGENLLSFRCAVSAAEQVTEVKVRSWDPKQKREIVGTSPAKSSASHLDVTPADLGGKFGSPTHLAASIPFATQAECEAAAAARAEDIGSASATFDGVALGNTDLKAGAAVSLGQVGKPFDGKYRLTSARHHYDPDGGYTTFFTVSGKQNSTLLGLASGGAAGKGSGSASRKPIPGVVQAIVTNAKDPENQCRVKLKFPWLDDTYESDWARVAQISAGNGYGAVLVPEVGDEVLVAFEQGDSRRPYVLAGLYNGVDKPPTGSVPTIDDASGKVQRRDFFSRTHHRLSFTEKEGTDDGILLQTGDSKYIVKLSKNNQKLTINADGTIEIECKGAPGDIKITAAGNLDLKGRQVSIKADSGVSIDGGGGNVEIKGVQLKANGTAQVTVQGATISINANATAELKGGAMVQVQGAIVKIN